jgi:hypothetical protein
MLARAVLVVLAIVAIAVTAVEAQFPLAYGPNRPIRIEGYWGRTRSDPEVLGEVTISAQGRPARRLGVTALQAYQPEEEGMQVLRFTSDHPATLLARGDAVYRLFSAAPDRKLVAFGTYMRGSGLFVVGSVDLVPSPER